MFSTFGVLPWPAVQRFAEMAGESRSVEQILRDWLEPAEEQNPPSTKPDAAQHGYRDLEDQLGLLARWSYTKPRAGEIFFREATA